MVKISNGHSYQPFLDDFYTILSGKHSKGVRGMESGQWWGKGNHKVTV